VLPATARANLIEALDALAPLPRAPQAAGERSKETHASTRSNGEIAQMRSNSEQRAEARSGEVPADDRAGQGRDQPGSRADQRMAARATATRAATEHGKARIYRRSGTFWRVSLVIRAFPHGLSRSGEIRR
jgi:hypothetical protein